MFGMNLRNGFEDDGQAFILVAGFGLIGSGALVAIGLRMLRNARRVGLASDTKRGRLWKLWPWSARKNKLLAERLNRRPELYGASASIASSLPGFDRGGPSGQRLTDAPKTDFGN